MQGRRSGDPKRLIISFAADYRLELGSTPSAPIESKVMFYGPIAQLDRAENF